MSDLNESPATAALPVGGGSNLGPQARYAADVESGVLLPDAAQANAIARVERLHRELLERHANVPGLFKRLFGFKRSTRPVQGLYLWGSVGRGKTYIIDTFFDGYPSPRKLRIHFHSFMRRVHADLKQLGEAADPLAIIGRRWAERIDLLCLDEFHVGDITDAMMLANLLAALFDNHVTLVATSNEAPQNLYRDGLQRERFLPAIALLQEHLDVVELTGSLDYRLRALEQAEVYYCPHTEETVAELTRRFVAIAPEPGEAHAPIEIEGRLIPTIRHADGVVWFDFATLCGGPRSTGDYIEIALCHHTVFLSDIPLLDKDASDATRRFINLIDELYDRQVNLVVSAAVEPEQLYTGSRLREPFKRTVSRLREMQSHDYLARPHGCD